MFQNISKDYDEEIFDGDVEYKSKKEILKEIFKKNFTIQNNIIYIIAFMISLIGGKNSLIFTSVAPFCYAMVAASLGSGVPAIIVCIVTFVANTIKFGASGALFFILTMLIFFAFILIKQPIEQEDKNEKFKVGMQMAVSVFIVQIIKILFKGFLVYDLLYTIMITIVTFLLYKIFVNSIIVFKEFKIKTVFSIEEIMGASLMLAIAVNSLSNVKIFRLFNK